MSTENPAVKALKILGMAVLFVVAFPVAVIIQLLKISD